MPTIAQAIAQRGLSIVATILLAAFLAACLVRIAPGFASDSSLLDPRLSAGSVAALRAERDRNRNIVSFYFHYLAGAARGDLGRSQLFHRPVAELIAERTGATVRVLAFGLLAGWTLALGLAAAVLVWRSAPLELGSTVLAGLFLCLPAAVLALALILFRAPAWLAIALVVFPKLFSYTRNLLAQAQRMPHVVTARAKGLSPARVFTFHVVPVTAAQAIALAGISVSMAIGAAIPIEALLSILGSWHGRRRWDAIFPCW